MNIFSGIEKGLEQAGQKMVHQAEDDVTEGIKTAVNQVEHDAKDAISDVISGVGGSSAGHKGELKGAAADKNKK